MKPRVVLYVVSIAADGRRAVLKDAEGFTFAVPSVLPDFLTEDSFIHLRTGQEISAVLIGQCDGITDVILENVRSERQEVESYQEVSGWTPYNNPQKPAGQQ